jgi:hypothetical protein
MFKEAVLLQLQAINKNSIGPKLLRISNGSGSSPGPRAFPMSSTVPSLPAAIPDELLDLYAFRFCQGGFHHLGMTFEQFLLVVATVKPGDLKKQSKNQPRVEPSA